MLEYKNCSIEDLEPYIKEAKKSGLVFCQNSQLFLVKRANIIVGFCGYIKYKNHIKIKNIYVLPEYRMQGIYREMLTWLINKAGKCHIVATCTSSSLPEFIKRGAVVTHKYKNYTSVKL